MSQKCCNKIGEKGPLLIKAQNILLKMASRGTWDATTLCFMIYDHMMIYTTTELFVPPGPNTKKLINTSTPGILESHSFDKYSTHWVF